MQDQVAQGIHDAFADAGIGIPYDIVTLDTTQGFDEAVARAGSGR